VSKGTAAVLGAGLQGICAALALRERGWRVRLLDQDPAPMLRASLRNEGKIHLGYIYANDTSFRTAELMFRTALQFAPLLQRWLPQRIDWSALCSAPFTYLAMRDSLLDPDALRRHYARIETLARDEFDRDADYLGTRPEFWWREGPLPDAVASQQVQTAFATPEVALDLPRFRALLCAALQAADGIEFLPHRRVCDVRRTGNGFRVETEDAAAQAPVDADIVVNCLWDGRLAIDQRLGMEAARPWVQRLKYRVLARLPGALQNLPALSLVLGPYGDVVPFAHEGSYLSWYPVCRQGWSDARQPPQSWDAPCRGDVDSALAAQVVRGTLQALQRVVPGIDAAQVSAVDAGVVWSWGDADIDCDESELHRRHEVGVHAAEGYFSIDTGKLTGAPWFAQQLVQQL
jgi:glycine/D-amino acid oxidase-like deaminating enzyme